jgi:hypothetical protein
MFVSSALGAIARTRHRGIKQQVETYWGASMTVVHPDQIARAIARYGLIEPDLTLALAKVLRPGCQQRELPAVDRRNKFPSCLAAPEGPSLQWPDAHLA